MRRVSGCGISATMTRAVDVDVATDLVDVRAGTVFGLIECDGCVPKALREDFGEIQPVFKNIRLTRDDLGTFMRRYAEDHNTMTTPTCMLVGSY